MFSKGETMADDKIDGVEEEEVVEETSLLDKAKGLIMWPWNTAMGLKDKAFVLAADTFGKAKGAGISAVEKAKGCLGLGEVEEVAEEDAAEE